VAKHGDRCGPLIVGWLQRTPNFSVDTEDLKVVPGYRFYVDDFRGRR
jgi:hypothetical protein